MPSKKAYKHRLKPPEEKSSNPKTRRDRKVREKKEEDVKAETETVELLPAGNKSNQARSKPGGGYGRTSCSGF